jgi:hypothetical protein
MSDTSPVTIGIPPVTKEQVTSAVNDLATAVKIEQSAEELLKTAQEVYDKEFAIWLADHPSIAGTLDLAEEGLKAAKVVKSGADKAVREIAPTYFADHPEARTETPGLAYRLERKPIIDDNFVMIAVKVGASFLLKPDDKAIKKFAQGMAVQDKETKRWSFPLSIDMWLDDALLIKNDYVVTISEDKLVAPEPEPEID